MLDVGYQELRPLLREVAAKVISDVSDPLHGHRLLLERIIAVALERARLDPPVNPEGGDGRGLARASEDADHVLRLRVTVVHVLDVGSAVVCGVCHDTREPEHLDKRVEIGLVAPEPRAAKRRTERRVMDRHDASVAAGGLVAEDHLLVAILGEQIEELGLAQPRKLDGLVDHVRGVHWTPSLSL